MFDEPVVISARPKIDARKHDYIRPGGQIEVRKLFLKKLLLIMFNKKSS